MFGFERPCTLKPRRHKPTKPHALHNPSSTKPKSQRDSGKACWNGQQNDPEDDKTDNRILSGHGDLHSQAPRSLGFSRVSREVGQPSIREHSNFVDRSNVSFAANLTPAGKMSQLFLNRVEQRQTRAPARECRASESSPAGVGCPVPSVGLERREPRRPPPRGPTYTSRPTIDDSASSRGDLSEELGN